MIVTVTANTSIDLVYFIPSFQLNATLRATRFVESIAGKPTDASWILGELGIPSLALGFKAGDTGERVEALLHEKGVITDFIPVEGDSRRCLVIICEDGSGQSSITPNSLKVSPHHVDTLRAKYEKALETATCAVLGGTLPSGLTPDFYEKMLIPLARERGVPTIIDLNGPNLRAGLRARPDYCKPNHDELGELLKRPIHSLEEAYRAGREVYETYGTCPVITLGKLGGIAVLPDRAYHIPPLEVTVVNTTGAGDAVLAGMAAAIAERKPPEEGLRLGFAAATAVVQNPGTAQCTRAEIEHFLGQVELVPFP